MDFFLNFIRRIFPIIYEFSIPAEIKQLKTIMFNCEKFLSRYNIDENLIFYLRLCVNEIVSNAIEHGFKYQQDKYVKVIFKLYIDRKIEIIVKDKGVGFDLKNLRLDKINKKKYRGRGLFLVNKLMDKLYIKSSRFGTKVKIIKYLNK